MISESLLAEWTQVKHVSEACLDLVEQCDVPFKEFKKTIVLEGRERYQHLTAVKEEYWHRTSDLFGQRLSATAREGSRYVASLGISEDLFENALRFLRHLVRKGDDRAAVALSCLLLYCPRAAQITDNFRGISFATKEFLSLHAGIDIDKARFANLGRKMSLVRDIAKSFYLDLEHARWEITKPPIHAVCLLLTCAHRSTILAGSYKMSAQWHVVEVQNLRRKWCTAKLLQKIERSSDARPPDRGMYDYHMDSIITWRTLPT